MVEKVENIKIEKFESIHELSKKEEVVEQLIPEVEKTQPTQIQVKERKKSSKLLFQRKHKMNLYKLRHQLKCHHQIKPINVNPTQIRSPKRRYSPKREKYIF